MANYRAIKAVCEGVLALLKTNYQPAYFNNTPLQFEVYLSGQFAKPMENGVSLFLYRVYPNGSQRTPAGRIGPGGERYKTQLPLDLHFLLTAWGKEASLQHSITGWMMRVLEDEPLLTPSLLNAIDPDVFSADESIEVVLTELNNEDLVGIWRDLIEYKFQLSIPYVARNVRIESTKLLCTGTPIQQRGYESGSMDGGQ